jgi:hypothetical protein
MKKRYLLLCLILSSFVSQEVLSHVLWENLANEVYPPEADSISIPLYMGLIQSILVLVVCFISALFPKTRYLRWGAICFAGMALLWTAGSVMYWLSPNHYAIAVSYVPTLCLCTYQCYQSLKIKNVTNDVRKET